MIRYYQRLWVGHPLLIIGGSDAEIFVAGVATEYLVNKR